MVLLRCDFSQICFSSLWNFPEFFQDFTSIAKVFEEFVEQAMGESAELTNDHLGEHDEVGVKNDDDIQILLRFPSQSKIDHTL